MSRKFFQDWRWCLQWSFYLTALIAFVGIAVYLFRSMNLTDDQKWILLLADIAVLLVWLFMPFVLSLRYGHFALFPRSFFPSENTGEDDKTVEKLARHDAVIGELTAKVERIDDLTAKVEQIGELTDKVERITEDSLHLSAMAKLREINNSLKEEDL